MSCPKNERHQQAPHTNISAVKQLCSNITAQKYASFQKLAKSKQKDS